MRNNTYDILLIENKIIYYFKNQNIIKQRLLNYLINKYNFEKSQDNSIIPLLLDHLSNIFIERRYFVFNIEYRCHIINNNNYARISLTDLLFFTLIVKKNE